jgi:hypothetical protein
LLAGLFIEDLICGQMEIVFYFLVIGISVACLLLLIDNESDNALDKVLRKARSIQPLFLIRSAEQKLSKLNTLLYGNIIITEDGRTVTQGRININEGARQIIISQLNMLTNDYEYSRITLKDYHRGLNELLITINKVKVLNFEQINK